MLADHQFILLRQKLVDTALEWQRSFGIAPAITSALSEFDAAIILGCEPCDYATCLKGRSAVSKGHDFTFNGWRYQVKANRPSGLPGSKVTLVPKAKNLEFDYLIWILYNTEYVISEAWQWDRESYSVAFGDRNRLAPSDYRKGKKLV